MSSDPHARLKVLPERLTDEETACNQKYARAEYPQGGATSRAWE